MRSLTGVVLCGGRSIRMKTDKCLLEYHGMKQWEHIYNMLSVFCSDIYISCNGDQLNYFNDAKVIADDERFAGAGPMTGVLSCLQATKNAVLVAGCDYPFLSLDVLHRLAQMRNAGAFATAVYNDATGMYEPTLCIYEGKALAALSVEFSEGRTSLQRFLQKTNAVKCTCSASHLANINTEDEFAAAMNRIGN